MILWERPVERGEPSFVDEARNSARAGGTAELRGSRTGQSQLFTGMVRVVRVSGQPHRQH